MTSTVEFFFAHGLQKENKTRRVWVPDVRAPQPPRLASPRRDWSPTPTRQRRDDKKTRKSPPPSSSLALQSPHPTHKFPSPLWLPASRRESKHRPGTNSSLALAISSDSFSPLPRSRALPDAEPWILTHISRTSAPRVSRGSGRSTDSRRLAGG